MLQRVILQQKILERTILLSMMIERYNRYSRIIGALYNLIAASTVLVATIVKLLNDGQFESGSTLVLILSIISLCITKIRDLLQFDHIVRICKEQILKYKRMLELIEQLPNDSEIEPHKASFANLQDFDPQIPYEIVEKFKQTCKAEGVTATFDDLAKYSELHKIESKMAENGQITAEEHKITVSSGELSPRTRQDITKRELDEFRNSLDLRISTAKLKKLETIKSGSI